MEKSPLNELHEKIKHIRHSWGELSEYCQDEIIDAVDAYVEAQRNKKDRE